MIVDDNESSDKENIFRDEPKPLQGSLRTRLC